MTTISSEHIKVVYLCHAFGSDPHGNAEQVRRICRSFALQDRLPLAPQIYLPQFLGEKSERDLALRCCLRMVALADELWIYDEPTEGMELEIAEARRLGIPLINCTKEGNPR